MLFKKMFEVVARVPACHYLLLLLSSGWSACPSPLGVLSVTPSLPVALVDSLTLVLGGYVPVLTRPEG